MSIFSIFKRKGKPVMEFTKEQLEQLSQEQKQVIFETLQAEINAKQELENKQKEEEKRLAEEQKALEEQKKKEEEEEEEKKAKLLQQQNQNNTDFDKKLEEFGIKLVDQFTKKFDEQNGVIKQLQEQNKALSDELKRTSPTIPRVNPQEEDVKKNEQQTSVVKGYFKGYQN